MHRPDGVIGLVANRDHPDGGHRARLVPRRRRHGAQQLAERLHGVKCAGAIQSCDDDLPARDLQHIAFRARGCRRDPNLRLLKQPVEQRGGAGFAHHNLPCRIADIALPDHVKFHPVAGAQLLVQLAGREEIFIRRAVADDDPRRRCNRELSAAPQHLFRNREQVNRQL